MADSMDREFHFASNALKLLEYFQTLLFNKLCTIIYMILNVTVALGAIIGFINREIVSEQIEIIYSSICLAFILSIYITIRRHYKSLKQFFCNISPRQSINADIKSEAFQLTIERAQQILPKMTIIMVCGLAILFISWIFTPLLNDFDSNNKNFYTFPYLFQCTRNSTNRFLTEFLCIKRKTPLHFFLINSLISILGLWAGTVGALTPFLFSLFICIFVDANISVIKKKLLQLEDEFGNIIPTRPQSLQVCEHGKISFVGNMQQNLMAKTQLLKIIKYHQHLFK